MQISVFWFRRDLRIDDNAALYHALKNNPNVLPVFIFDTGILNRLEDKQDRRVHFIHSAILSLQKELQSFGSCIRVYHGQPLEVFKKIIAEYPVLNVYANHDYEPEA